MAAMRDIAARAMSHTGAARASIAVTLPRCCESQYRLNSDRTCLWGGLVEIMSSDQDNP